MWKFAGLSPWQVARQTLAAYTANHLSAHSAQFAYYSMLAIVPLLITVVACVGYLPLHGVLGSFLQALERGLPRDAYQLLAGLIDDIQARSSTTYLVGSVLVFLFAGSRLFLTMGEGLNAAFGLPVHQGRIRAHWLSLLMTFGIILLLVTAMVLLVLGPMILNWAMDFFEMPDLESFLSHAIRWAIVTLCLLILTSAIYCFVPATRVPWRWFTPGNVFAVAGWTLVSQGFRIYVERFALYNQTYGALGGVIVLLLWLYLTGALLFLGGQLNGVIFQALVGNPTGVEPSESC